MTDALRFDADIARNVRRLAMVRPTFVSLFAGVGGMDLAFEAAGWQCVGQVEIDDFCNRILSLRWPDVYRVRDVCTCTGRTGKGWRRYHLLPRVDALIGGFPCTDISLAGKGAGIRVGTRSGLWFEFARLIGELRPHLVLLENVSAILARDGDVVVATLAALGYDARWGTLRASDAGAAHQRERWFCVAHATNRNNTATAWHSADNRQSDGSQERAGFQSGFSNHSKHGELGDSTRRGTDAVQQPGRLQGAEFAGQGLAHTADTRLSHGQRPGQSAHGTQGGTGMECEPERCSELAHTGGEGLAGWQGQPGHDGAQQQTAERDGNVSGETRTNRVGTGYQREKGTTCELGNAQGIHVQGFRSQQCGGNENRGPGSRAQRCQPIESRLGGDVDGLSAWLDRSYESLHVARPGQPQHDWEPARITNRRDFRASRLKALGNAVVPQVIYPIACAMREWLEVTA